MNNNWLKLFVTVFYITFLGLCIYSLIKLDVLLIISCSFNAILLACIVNHEDDNRNFSDFIEEDDCGYDLNRDDEY